MWLDWDEESSLDNIWVMLSSRYGTWCAKQTPEAKPCTAMWFCATLGAISIHIPKLMNSSYFTKLKCLVMEVMDGSLFHPNSVIPVTTQFFLPRTISCRYPVMNHPQIPKLYYIKKTGGLLHYDALCWPYFLHSNEKSWNIYPHPILSTSFDIDPPLEDCLGLPWSPLLVSSTCYCSSDQHSATLRGCHVPPEPSPFQEWIHLAGFRGVPPLHLCQPVTHMAVKQW